MYISLHQPDAVSGGHGDGCDSDDSSTVSSDDDSDDKIESTQNNVPKDLSDLSAEVNVRLLLH